MKPIFFTNSRLFLVFLLFTLSLPLLADCVTFDLTTLQTVQSLQTSPVTITFGSNVEVLNESTANCIRLQRNGTMTVSVDEAYQIYAVDITGGAGFSNISANCGTYKSGSGHYVGTTPSVTFTGTISNSVKISSIQVFYAQKNKLHTAQYNFKSKSPTWNGYPAVLACDNATLNTNYTVLPSGATFSITPQHGCIIRLIQFTATTINYATYLQESSWTTSPLLFANNFDFYYVPNDGGSDIFATIGDATRITDVIVTYEVDNYSRTTKADNFGTICLPFAVTPEDRTGATFYSITGRTDNGIILSEVTGSLAAGQPYIFKANAATLTAIYSGEGVSSPVTTTGLVGNLGSEKMQVPKDCYILKGNELHLVLQDGMNVTVSQNRAYITTNGVPRVSNVKGFTLGFESDEDNIQGIAAPDIDDAIYDLAGRRVMTHGKGLYIKNGKKYLK